MKLKNRTALVTGASRGIGRAIALALAEEGADVAVNYVSNEGLAKEVAEQIQKLGRRAILAACPCRLHVERPRGSHRRVTGRLFLALLLWLA